MSSHLYVCNAGDVSINFFDHGHTLVKLSVQSANVAITLDFKQPLDTPIYPSLTPRCALHQRQHTLSTQLEKSGPPQPALNLNRPLGRFPSQIRPLRMHLPPISPNLPLHAPPSLGAAPPTVMRQPRIWWERLVRFVDVTMWA